MPNPKKSVQGSKEAVLVASGLRFKFQDATCIIVYWFALLGLA